LRKGKGKGDDDVLIGSNPLLAPTAFVFLEFFGIFLLGHYWNLKRIFLNKKKKKKDVYIEMEGFDRK
jgi:hypothetical protein